MASTREVQQPHKGRTPSPMQPTSQERRGGAEPDRNRQASAPRWERYLGNSHLQSMAEAGESSRRSEQAHAAGQGRTVAGTGETSQPAVGVPRIVREVLRSSGEPLEPTTRLAMESLFGRDFGQVRVHRDTRAAESAQAVKARAYTLGRDVVFGPGLYRPSTPEGRELLVHELVHVTQQSGMPVNAEGEWRLSSPSDVAEQEAHQFAQNALTDTVSLVTDGARGLQVPQILNPGGIQSNFAGVIQRDTAGSETKRANRGRERWTLPNGVDYQVRGEYFVARREWLIQTDNQYDPTAVWSPAPTAIAVILKEMRAAGVLARLTDEQIDSAASKLKISGPTPPERTVMGIRLFLYTLRHVGPTGEQDFQWRRDQEGMTLVIRKAILSRAKKSDLLDISRLIWAELEDVTGLAIPEEPEALRGTIENWLVNRIEQRLPNIPEEHLGYIEMFDRKTMEKVFGPEQWAAYLALPRASDADIASPSGGSARRQGASRRGAKSKRGSIRFAQEVSRQDRAFFREFMKQLRMGRTSPRQEQGNVHLVTQELINALKRLDQHPHRDAALQALRGRRGQGTSLTAAAIENAMSDAEFAASFDILGLEQPEVADDAPKPILDEPVEGDIVNRSGRLHTGEVAQFFFKTRHKADGLRVPLVSVKWTITPKGKPKTHIAEEPTSHIDLQSRQPDYFEYTFTPADLLLSPERTFIVHAQVDHNFYRPAYFSMPIEVKTEAERMAELREKAFKSLGSYQAETYDFETSWFEETFGDDKYDVGKKFYGQLPTDFKRLDFEDRIAFIARNRTRAQELIDQYDDRSDSRSEAIVEYAQDYLDSLKQAEETLSAEDKAGYTFFETRATFLSRKSGVPDKALHLVSNVERDSDGNITVRIHDYTKLSEPVDYTFTGEGRSFEVALEEAFLDLTKAYPPGRVAFLAERLDDETLDNPKREMVGFELATGTTWKAIKSVVYHPYAQMAVNIIGTVVMVFVPITAPFIFPALLAYNGIDTLDNMAELKAKGRLGATEVAEGLASIGLDLLPYVGRAKIFLRSPKASWFIIEGADLAGQAVVMSSEGLRQVEHMRSQYIEKIAELEAEIKSLEELNPSHPELKALEAKRDKLVSKARDASLNVFGQMVAQNSIMILTPKAFQQLTRRGSRQEIDALFEDGTIRHDPNATEPYYDAGTQAIVANKETVTAAELETLRHDIAKAEARASDRPEGHTSRPNAPRPSTQFSLVDQKIWRYGGRDVVVVNTTQGPRGFYRRTGNGNEGETVETGAQIGDWVPFDGLQPQPGGAHFVKSDYTSSGDLRRWGSEEFREIGQWLSRQNLREGEDVGGAWGIVQQHLEKFGAKVAFPIAGRPSERPSTGASSGGRNAHAAGADDVVAPPPPSPPQRIPEPQSLPRQRSDIAEPPSGGRPSQSPGASESAPPSAPAPRARRTPSPTPPRRGGGGASGPAAPLARPLSRDEALLLSIAMDEGRLRTPDDVQYVSWVLSRELYEDAWIRAAGSKGGDLPDYGFVDPRNNAVVIHQRPDVLDPGGRLERSTDDPNQIDRRHYHAREFFGETLAHGAEQARYYADANLRSDGVVDLEFRLRRDDVGGAPGIHRSSRLRGREEFNRALDHFEQHNGSDSVKGIRGDWSEGDNLDLFNRFFRERRAEGLSPQDAAREAARETHTGRWAEERGFSQVEIEQSYFNPPHYDPDIEIFESMVVIFRRGATTQTKSPLRRRRRGTARPTPRPSGPARRQPPAQGAVIPDVQRGAAAPTRRGGADELALRELHRDINEFLGTGVTLEYPPLSRVQQAQEALEDGPASVYDLEVLVRQSVADARALIRLSKSYQPLTYRCLHHACPLGRDISVASLGSLALESGMPVRLQRFQSEVVFGANKHGFSVVTFSGNPPIRYLVDPTFGQFMHPEGADPNTSRFSAEVLRDTPEGLGFARDLIRDGFVVLDERRAALYARALGVPESQAADVGRRLLEGQNTLTEEVVGGQVDVVAPGVHRGPITQVVEGSELEQRIENQSDEIRDIEDSLELTTHYREAAEKPGESQALVPALKELEKRLQKVKDATASGGPERSSE